MIVEKLISENLILREIKSKDIFAYSELFSDTETMALFGGPTINNVLDLKNVIPNKQKEAELNQALFWSITEKEDREFIGFIRLMNYESIYFNLSYEIMGSLKDSPEFSKYIQRKGWEIDYALLPNYRNKGIMSESIRLVIKYCFENNLKPIYAKVNNVSNKSTINVLIKNGFGEHLPLQNQNGELGMIYKLENNVAQHRI